jgi:hypothetical protein
MATIIDDPCYPQITKAMDKAFVCRALQAALFPSAHANDQGDFLIVSCDIKNLRHKPSKRFMLSYPLELVNTRTGARRNQLVSGSLCKVGLGRHVLGSEGNKQSSAVYIAALDMLVWVFPLDRKLIYLAQIHQAMMHSTEHLGNARTWD